MNNEQPIIGNKGLARYIGVHLRTAQRYRKIFGIPVHRVTHQLIHFWPYEVKKVIYSYKMNNKER